MLDDHVDVVDVDVVGPVSADLGLVDLGQDNLGELASLALSQGAYPKLQKPLASGGETRMRITSMGLGTPFAMRLGIRVVLRRGE